MSNELDATTLSLSHIPAGFAAIFAESLRLSGTVLKVLRLCRRRRSLKFKAAIGKPEAFRKEHGKAVTQQPILFAQILDSRLCSSE